MAGGIDGFVSEDPERDWALVAPHVAYHFDSYRRYMVEGTGRSVPRPVDPDVMRSRSSRGPLSSFLFDTPENVAAHVGKYAGEAPVETVWFGASVAGLAEESVARHVQVICKRLRPLLQEGAR
jgi:hypothetical protein